MAAGVRATTAGISSTGRLAVASGCRERSGGLIGGQIGYRWQASQWVFGLEAQGDWADLSNTRVSLIDPAVLHSHQDRWHRPLHRPDRLRLECSAVVRKGRRGGDEQPLQHPRNVSGIELASASSTRWGGTVGVGFEYGFTPNWSFGVEYNHLFMGDANNSFSVPQSGRCRLRQQPDQPGRGHGHRAHQLPLRRLRGADSGPLLISLRRTSPGIPCRGFFTPWVFAGHVNPTAAPAANGDSRCYGLAPGRQNSR